MVLCNKRSHCSEKPMYCNKDPVQPKNKPNNDTDLTGFCESETGVADVKRLEEG